MEISTGRVVFTDGLDDLPKSIAICVYDGYPVISVGETIHAVSDINHVWHFFSYGFL